MDSFKNMEKKTMVKYALIAIVVIIVATSLLGSNKETVKNDTEKVVATTTTKPATKTVATAPKAPSKNVMNRCNFRVTSPEMYSSVTMPFTVTGVLDKANNSTGCDWNETSLRAGDAEIFYNRRNEGWKSAGTSVPIVTRVIPGDPATTLTFSISFNLYTAALGLTSGTPIKIVFTELNTTKLPNPDIFDFQVTLR